MSSKRGMGSAASTLQRRTAGVPVITGAAAPSLVSALAAPGGSNDGLTVQWVRVDEVAAHPDNPRETLGDLAGLAESIKELGVRQPVLVVPAAVFAEVNPSLTIAAGKRWVVIAGHRRCAAAELAGVDQIPAWIRPDLGGAQDAAETFVVENFHRTPLAPLEEARAFSMLADLKVSQRTIAQRLGVSQGHVSKRLSLLRLPQEVQDALTRDEVTVGDALALTAVGESDQADVYELARRRNVPIPAAVGELERQRTAQRAFDKAKRRASREKLQFVDVAQHSLTTGGRMYTLYDKAEVEAARKEGTLMAGARPNGEFAYFSTTNPSAASRDEAAEERHRKAAIKVRTEAAAQLVSSPPPLGEAHAALVHAVLFDTVHYGDALKLAHKWLGDSVGITQADPYRWRDSLETADAATRGWVAWAITIGAAESQTRWRNRPWDERERAYLALLSDRVNYEPTDWEAQRLAKVAAKPADDAGDSDGITEGQE